VRAAQDGLLQAEKMAFAGKLAAGVVHEVGNPLASISSIAQMMRRECHNEQEAERIDVISRHVARISRVVQEMLAFARPPATNGQGPVEISTLLDRTIELLRYDKRSDAVKIVRSYEPGLSIEHGSRDLLLLVFTNILGNSLDALAGRQNGDAHIAVKAREEAGRIIVRLEDDGPGMSQEQIEAAFDPFFTTKEPGAGTGLGLWVCLQIVRRHQAGIRIDSRVGRGTAVIIDLPKDLPEQAVEPTLVEC
jgi:signal transduction histidine kinase